AEPNAGSRIFRASAPTDVGRRLLRTSCGPLGSTGHSTGWTMPVRDAGGVMAGKQFRTSLGVALAVVAVLGTACGGGGGGTTSGATGSQQTGPTGPTSATSPPIVTGVTGVTGATTSPSDEGTKLSGTWSGTWKDTTDPAEGTFKLTWQQSGPTLSGTITIAGTPCLGGGQIAGALNGSTISFG